MKTALLSLVTASFLGLCGCSIKVSDKSEQSGSGTGQASVTVDGSSTVLPISQAVAEEFQKSHPNVKVSVSGTGTSSGFKRLIGGDVDVANASRPIADKEKEQLQAKGIEYVELKVAMDGLTIAVSRENTWCTALTVGQLRDLWRSGSPIKKWNQIDPSWPDAPIKLYGAGANSGTFDYFTEEITGKRGDTREDYNQSENDNELVIGVSGDKNALGYFGYSYFDENRAKLNVVKVAPGDDISAAVEPSLATIENGTYTPLSRPLFIYVKKSSLERPEVREFVEFYLSDEGQLLVEDAHCVKLHAEELQESRNRVQSALASPAK